MGWSRFGVWIEIITVTAVTKSGVWHSVGPRFRLLAQHLSQHPQAGWHLHVLALLDGICDHLKHGRDDDVLRLPSAYLRYSFRCFMT